MQRMNFELSLSCLVGLFNCGYLDIDSANYLHSKGYILCCKNGKVVGIQKEENK